MVVDEIDKAGGEHAYDPLGALYGLLEHDTAGSFVDEFAEVPIDASQVIWVATANDGRAIPDPILNRMNVYEVQAPRPRRRAPHRRPAVRRHPAATTAGANASTPNPRPRGAGPHGRDGPARDAPRLDDGLRQCQAGAPRARGLRGPARNRRPKVCHRFHAVAVRPWDTSAHWVGRGHHGFEASVHHGMERVAPPDLRQPLTGAMADGRRQQVVEHHQGEFGWKVRHPPGTGSGASCLPHAGAWPRRRTLCGWRVVPRSAPAGRCGSRCPTGQVPCNDEFTMRAARSCCAPAFSILQLANARCLKVLLSFTTETRRGKSSLHQL